jgi:tetratricopeptide (TPR) repeat protein
MCGLVRCGMLAMLLTCVCMFGGCRFTAQGQNQAGVQQFQVGNVTAASAHFNEALRLNPKNADAHYNLGSLYHQYAKQNNDRNSFAQAETLYRNCLALETNHVDAHRAFAVLLAETNRADQAFALLKKWSETNTTSAEPRVELARLYHEYGDRATADTYLQQALQINPYSSRALAGLGKLREDGNDQSQALAYYERAFQLNPSQPGVQERIAALSQRGVNPTPNIGPFAPGTTGGTRVVNGPGPMRRFN